MADFKKICTGALCLTLCFSAAPASAAATEAERPTTAAEDVEGVVISEKCSYYPLGDGKATLVRIIADGDTLDIPEKVDDMTITEIEDVAFEGVDVSVINIPATVEYISAENPFTHCENLTAVNVAEDNTAYCSVDGVLYSKDKTSLLCCPPGIKGSSFTVPDSVTSLGVAAFYNTGFSSVELPAGLTEIKRHAFSSCAALTAADLTGTKVETIGDMAYASCEKLSQVKLPDTLTSLGGGAFALCKLITEVNLPDGLTTIGQSAFQGTGLSRIVIPASVETIEYCAFGYDENETPDESFVIVGEPGSAAETYATDTDDEYGIANNFQFVSTATQAAIDEYEAMDKKTEGDFEYTEKNGSAALIFCYSSDENITVPSELGGLKVTEIMGYAFYSCQAVSITIPDGVETIGEYAFPTTVRSITLPGSLKKLSGTEPFIACSELAEINVTDGSGEYSSQDGILYSKDKSELLCYPIGKTDESFTAPASVKKIGYSAFCNNLHLKKADISGVEIIDTYAFDGCAALNQVVLGKSLKSVGVDSFYGCPNLKSIRLYDSVETIGDYAFGYIYDASVLEQQEQSSLEAYMTGQEEEQADGSVLVEGFKIYAPKNSLGYKYAKASGIEVVTGTIPIGEKNVSLGFLYTIGGILLALILALAGIFTGKKIKASREEKKRARSKAEAAEKLRKKSEDKEDKE